VTEIALFAVAALVVLAIARALLRANELFVVRFRGGRAQLVRGRIPARLLADLTDVVRAAAVEDAELRAVSEAKRPTLVARGAFSAADAQRLRNVIGLWTVAQIRSGGASRSR